MRYKACSIGTNTHVVLKPGEVIGPGVQPTIVFLLNGHVVNLSSKCFYLYSQTSAVLSLVQRASAEDDG